MLSENDAFDFFVSRIKKQADKSSIVLSDLEINMLRFSVETTNESLLQQFERFNKEVNGNEYEKKIVRLLREAFESELSEALKGAQEHIRNQYIEASKKLREKDNYITIMIDQVIKQQGFLSRIFKSRP